MVILWLLLAGYVAICALLYFRQDGMLFFPQHAPDLDAQATAAGFEPWLNAKGELLGWQSRDGDPQNVLLIFHGNGGYALHRNYFRYLTRNSGDDWKTFLLEYPGYGDRPGPISEASLTAAAVEAIDELAKTPGRTIRILGQSMGSGVASAAVGLRPKQVAGLILVTPYNSLVAAASSHYPWLPVRWILRTRFDSEKNLAAFPGPVAFVVAGRDATIPPHLAQKFFDQYSGRKRLWWIAEAGHNDSDALLADWAEIVKWLDSRQP